MPPPIAKCRVRPMHPGPAQAFCGGGGGRGEARYLLLGRLVLEAGVLDVIGPDGLVLLVLGAQVLHGLGDGQPTALDVLAADPARSEPWGPLRELWRRDSEVPLASRAATASSALWRVRTGQPQACQRTPCEQLLRGGKRPSHGEHCL